VSQLSGTIYPSLINGEINQIHNQLQSMRDRVVMQPDSLVKNGSWVPWVRGYGMTLSADIDDCSTEGYRQEVTGVELGTGLLSASGLGLHGFFQLGSTDTDLSGINQNADSNSYRFGGAVQYVGELAYLGNLNSQSAFQSGYIGSRWNW